MNGRAGSVFGGAALGVALLVGSVARAQCPQPQNAQPQSPAPQYLPFSEFASDDSETQRSARQSYNDAVERYNKTLYDYHVTLGQVNQLADLYNCPTATPAERDKARAESTSLRAKLESLRRDATTLAAAVDQARRKASQTGVTFTR
jgi:hypothetical protein